MNYGVIQEKEHGFIAYRIRVQKKEPMVLYIRKANLLVFTTLGVFFCFPLRFSFFFENTF